MAGITVTATMGVMKPLLQKLTKLMGDHYNKLKDLPKEVSFLERELSAMNALLEKMDEADELDPQDKIWRKDIIEMSYDIEDYIDDFMHCVGQADDKVGILKKASHYLKTFKDRRRLADQFQEIKARVLQASERRERYKFNELCSGTSSEVIDPRVSALYKESTSLVGIDTQKEKLVNWVIDEEKQLEVMSIVGFGGLGKTTLANEVYREVGAQFPYKAFISVSQKPDMIVLLNSLLSQFGLCSGSHACKVEDLINSLRKHLEDKRYLVVVDDLWDARAWNVISFAFQQSNQQSRVIITTRDKDVATTASRSHHGSIHDMKLLSKADSRKLFFNIIFGSEDGCSSQFKEISCEILKKCGGLPLAIITIAGILACQPTKLKEQWEYIRNSLATTKFSRISTVQDMMYILDLSYKSLPRHLKACFLYLGTYPEDYYIRRVELVRQWVAEGFLSHSPGQDDVWVVAERCFNELVNRSMIQPIYSGDGEDVETSGCRVHDMMLDLIARRCEEDNFLSLVNDPRDVAEGQVDRTIRRLTVHLRDVVDGTMATSTTTAGGGERNISHIRSLTIVGKQKWMPALLEMKFLRVLSLGFNYTNGSLVRLDLTGIISRLSQLRYLRVAGYVENVVMPARIMGGRCLETLNLSGLLESSPAILSEVVDVPRLSHLVVPEGTRLPKGIGEAKSLRTLRGFDLPVSSLESIIGLGELTALSEMFVSCNNPPKEGAPLLPTAKWMAALGTSLGKLGNLRWVCLGNCSYLYASSQVACCADALGSQLSGTVAPPFGKSSNSLQRLCVSDWTFSVVPRWINGHLHGLCMLRLGVKRITQEGIDAMGILPSLLNLYLRIVHAPTTGSRIVIGGGGLFKLLRSFDWDCAGVGVSRFAFEAGAMPALRMLELTIDACEWDGGVPDGLHHLASLVSISVWRGEPWVWRGQHGSDYVEEEEKRAKRKATDALIRGVLQQTVDALPTRPAFDCGNKLRIRPDEEEDGEDRPTQASFELN